MLSRLVVLARFVGTTVGGYIIWAGLDYIRGVKSSNSENDEHEPRGLLRDTESLPQFVRELSRSWYWRGAKWRKATWQAESGCPQKWSPP